MSGVVVLNQINAKLVNAAGYSVAIPDGYSLTTENVGFLIAGSDGYKAEFIRVGSDGTLKIDPIGTTSQPIIQQSSTAVRTSVEASLSSVQLLAANSARKSAIIFNDSISGILSIGYNTAVTTTDFTIKIGVGGYHHLVVPVFVGQINGIWSVADGYARITELT